MTRRPESDRSDVVVGPPHVNSNRTLTLRTALSTHPAPRIDVHRTTAPRPDPSEAPENFVITGASDKLDYPD